MKNDAKGINGAQLRILQVVVLLAEDVVIGIKPGQIAKALAVEPPYITRDLATLKAGGYAIKNEETGHWLLTGKLGAVGIKVMSSISRAERNLDQVKSRFTNRD